MNHLNLKCWYPNTNMKRVSPTCSLGAYTYLPYPLTLLPTATDRVLCFQSPRGPPPVPLPLLDASKPGLGSAPPLSTPLLIALSAARIPSPVYSIQCALHCLLLSRLALSWPAELSVESLPRSI